MSEAQGPPIAVKPIPLNERLRRYSLPDVERALCRLIDNGELADYDDEWANRVKDAIDLCVAVRELLPTLAAPVPAREWMIERLTAELMAWFFANEYPLTERRAKIIAADLLNHIFPPPPAADK